MANKASPTDPDALSIQLLGRFRVAIGSRIIPERAWSSRKAARLVKLLALAPNHCLHREQITDLLWPELDPDAGTNNRYKVLYLARHALEPSLRRNGASSYLRLQRELVLLAPPGPLHIDVEAFQAAARAAHLAHDPALYAQAVALYTGDLLPEDRFQDWVVGPREQLKAAYCALLVELATLREQGGDLGGALDALRQVVASDSVHEQAHVCLMRLLVRSGQRHLALRQYQYLRDALQQELDAKPAPVTQAFYRHILGGHDSSADVREASEYLAQRPGG